MVVNKNEKPSQKRRFSRRQLFGLMMKYKIPISEIGKTLHPYLTLAEGIKLAAQAFDKDVKSLSCCAS